MKNTHATHQPPNATPPVINITPAITENPPNPAENPPLSPAITRPKQAISAEKPGEKQNTVFFPPLAFRFGVEPQQSCFAIIVIYDYLER